MEYPLHIQTIVNLLNTGGEPAGVLTSFAHLLRQDVSLFSMYCRLGFSPSSGTFRYDLSRSRVLAEIDQEYLIGSPKEYSCLNMMDESAPVAKDDYKKGLKKISRRVREVICTSGFSSYKQVADQLINEIDFGGKEKEQKNVLRRVYDALNVLMSVDAIVKKNKKYYWNGFSSFLKTETNEVLFRKRADNHMKREKLKALTYKYYSLIRLIQRNKENHESAQIVKLPFVIISTQAHSNNMIKINYNSNQTSINARFSRRIHLIQDTDILLKLTFNQIPNDSPEELFQLINKPLYL